MVRIGVALSYMGFFGIILRYIQTDYPKTKMEMLAHSLIVQDYKLILKLEDVENEYDLQNTHRVCLKYRKGEIISILIEIDKNQGLKIKGYENMEKLKDLIVESVPPEKVVKRT